MVFSKSHPDSPGDDELSKSMQNLDQMILTKTVYKIDSFLWIYCTYGYHDKTIIATTYEALYPYHDAQLTFNAELKIIKNVFTFCIISWILFYKRSLNSQWSNRKCCLSYTRNTMPAEALATSGARASAGMVLIPKAGIYSVSSIWINS